MRGRLSIVLVALVVAATACSDGVTAEPTSTTTTAPSTTAPTATTTTTEPESVVLKAWTLDDHIAWFLDLINGSRIDAAGYEARFDDAFRAQIPLGQFTPVLDQLPGPWKRVAVDRAGNEATLLIEGPDGLRLNVFFAIGEDAKGRLGGLFLAPAALDDPPETLEALVAQWESLAPSAAIAITTVSGGSCPASAPEDTLPIGSAFKLWVLGALAEAVTVGSVDWDDTVVISDELKSLPSGVLQDEPAGTEMTVLEVAELMISISDNTATDHLIALVGREQVEEAVASMGHTEPGLNRPFLMTRELFHLKAVADEATRDAYINGTETTRRAILDGLDIDLSGFDPASFVDGVYDPATLEWFASPADICRALVWLLDASTQPLLAPIRDILSQNPGVAIDSATWPWVGFKGGSEPGVLSLSWIAERADGEVFVISGILLDEEGGLDQIGPALLLEHAFTLLADQ